MLSDLVDRYLLVHPVCPQHAALLRTRLHSLEQFAGLDPLCYDAVNRFLADLDHRPATIAGYRANILALWRFAADLGEADWPNPRRIRRPVVPAPMVDCYTVSEANRLVRAAGVFPVSLEAGNFWRLYWPALIRTAWDTGLRRGDLWRLGSHQIAPDGRICLVVGKTGRRVYTAVRPSTLAALSDLPKGRPLAWPYCARYFARCFAQLARSAGVNRGSFKWLRRSSGSYVEAIQAGAGAKHLGHSSAACFSRYYDAQAVSQARPVLPPELS